MMLDLHDNIKAAYALAPVAAVTNNTAFVSQVLDTTDFGAAEFLAIFGAVGNGTFTVLVEDSPDNVTFTTVPAANLLGAIACAPVANQTYKIGYIGPNRYVRVTITPAANTGNIFLAAAWVQAHGRKPPFSTQLN